MYNRAEKNRYCAPKFKLHCKLTPNYLLWLGLDNILFNTFHESICHMLWRKSHLLFALCECSHEQYDGNKGRQKLWTD